MSIGSYLEPLILDAVFNNVSLAVTATYVKLHTGDPGEAGTANAAGETTRKAASWTSASGGSLSSDTTLTWSTVSTTELVSHISVWDASTSGNHLWNGPLVAAYQLNSGDTFVIPSGAITVAIT